MKGGFAAIMIPIINSQTIPYANLVDFAITKNAKPWYFRALKALWIAGVQTSVDPTVLAAQCALETGWGKFGGAVTEQHGNTGGMKTYVATGDKPDDHARFALSPDGLPLIGALAHAHHLCLYAGFPIPANSPDERARHIISDTSPTSLFGSAQYVEELSGKWAPSLDYGNKIATIIGNMKSNAMAQ